MCLLARTRAVELVAPTQGFGRLTVFQLLKWIKLRDKPVKKKRGIRIDTKFEADVWGKLVIATLRNLDGEGLKATVETSIVYSYAIVIDAAKEVQLETPTENRQVQKLKFSPHWVFRFLQRQRVRRRKITSVQKEIPDEKDVQSAMAIGQALINEKSFSAAQIWNMDETGYTWAIGPEYAYVGTDARRAEGEQSDDKMRITLAIAGNSIGIFMPLFIILKHTVSSEEKPDQTGMKVIQHLHRRNTGFGVADGWELKIWERRLTIKNRKNETSTENHKCWYIINTTTGHVITSQVKAWNDTVRMAMLIDLIWLPIRQRDGGMIVWMDNCGSHKTQAIVDLLQYHDISVAMFPPNMTAFLQMLDLVVNGPIKQHTRFKRANAIVEAFKLYQVAYNAECVKTDVEGRKIIHFRPPKPIMEQCIKDMLSLFVEGGQFTVEKFRSSMRATMIKTGCCPRDDKTDRVFEKYDAGMIKRNKAIKPMLCIPTGSRMPIVPIKGTVEVEAESQALHNRMTQMMNDLLVETDSEEDNSDSDSDSDDESDYDNIHESDDDSNDESESSNDESSHCESDSSL